MPFPVPLINVLNFSLLLFLKLSFHCIIVGMSFPNAKSFLLCSENVHSFV